MDYMREGTLLKKNAFKLYINSTHIFMHFTCKYNGILCMHILHISCMHNMINWILGMCYTNRQIWSDVIQGLLNQGIISLNKSEGWQDQI